MYQTPLPLLFVLCCTLHAAAQDSLDKAYPFIDGFARVARGDSSFYIDTTGKFAFNEITAITGGDGTADKLVLVRGTKDRPDHWGMLRAGRWLLAPEYDTIDTRFNVWKLSRDGKSTWCDTSGKLLLPLRFSDAGYLDGRYFDVCQGGKWGIYDAQRDSVVIPFQYDGFDFCGGCGDASDYVFAQRDQQWGVIGFDNKVRVPFAYEHTHRNMRSDEWVQSFQRNGRPVLINMLTGKVFGEPEYTLPEDVLWNGLVCVGQHKKFGLVTAAGKPVTNFDYDEIFWYEEAQGIAGGYASVKKNGLYGLIDSTGSLIIPVRQGGEVSIIDDSTFDVYRNERHLLIDRHGRPLLPVYFKTIQPVSEGVYVVSGDGHTWGLYNRHTRVLTPCIYNDISDDEVKGFLIVKKGARKGLLNLQGKTILPPRYDDIATFESFPDKLDIRIGDHKGLCDTSGKILLAPVYDWVEQDGDDTTCVKLVKMRKEGDLAGLATLQGRMILPLRSGGLDRIGNDRWLLRKDGTFFLINSRTGQKDSLPYSDVSFADANGWLIVSDGKGVKLLDPVSQRIVADGYDEIDAFRNDVAHARKDSLEGAIGTTGKVAVPFVYARLSSFMEGMAVVQKNDSTYGIVDTTGKVVVPLQYDIPNEYFSTEDAMLWGDLVLFRRDTESGSILKGLARRDGTIITPPRFEVIWKDTARQEYLVRQNGKFGIMAADGKMIIPAIYQDMMAIDMSRLYNSVQLTYPLLCYDGDRWQYVMPGGKTLPFTIREANREEQ
ncbi:WG repeat-containing protein [Dinghuibacter silviterrae]|uniref:WG repeat protein n=1 Tax=Dinghuibacter silviterrae TaxID=1539049 RepID=A0A4R8DTJ2_9BACT|nr:WG repeat-containing protein [Dinghuibacter silviterrae]TDX01439.1 WG repeat protein [Dinghuibacter silviterrae]